MGSSSLVVLIVYFLVPAPRRMLHCEFVRLHTHLYSLANNLDPLLTYISFTIVKISIVFAF